MEIAHCSTVPNDKKKLSIWYASLIDRNSSRAWQPLSRVNVTGLLRRLQVKIENIYLFKILIKKHENVFKSWLCLAQIFSCCPKNPSCSKVGGAAAPLAPPARTPMISRFTPPVLSMRIVLSRFYLLILYFENFSTCLTFSVCRKRHS